MAEQVLDPNVGDFAVTLTPGQGIWVQVEDDKGDKLVVHIVCDRLLAMLRVDVCEPGKEDETPMDSIMVDF